MKYILTIPFDLHGIYSEYAIVSVKTLFFPLCVILFTNEPFTFKFATYQLPSQLGPSKCWFNDNFTANLKTESARIHY